MSDTRELIRGLVMADGGPRMRDLTDRQLANALKDRCELEIKGGHVPPDALAYAVATRLLDRIDKPGGLE